MSRRALTLFLGTLLVSGISAKEPDISVVDPVSVLFSNNNRFALHLFPLLDSSSSNVLFSPFSLYSALSMVWMGAEEKTKEAMQHALQFSLEPSDLKQAYSQFFLKREDSRLKIANAVWANRDTFFLPSFLFTLQENFQANASSLDFKNSVRSSSIINEWIENQTEGKIPTLLEPSQIDPLTRMIVTNALYFKGRFSSPFDPGQTKDAPFYPSEDHSLVAPMMHQVNSFSYFEDEDFQVLSLPFEKEEKEDQNISLLIFLPTRREGLSLSVKQLKEAIRGLKRRTVNVMLPKFTQRQRLILNDPLKNLGMEIAFSERADFSKINGLHDLFLSLVIHEAYVALDEMGVVAAAATAASMKTTAVRPTPGLDFLANRPFLFLLVDLDTQGIFFLGKLYTPL